MMTAVIGHRGTGKTELMLRLRLYLGETQGEILDLDEEIEKKIGKSIREMFLEHGESYFRELERQLFLEILQRQTAPCFLVLGAGFDLSVIPEAVTILWVKRRTDADGRIFLNRPRLDPEVSPIQEFKQRAFVREAGYRSRAHQVYVMPEGHFENKHRALAVEKKILTQSCHDIGGGITILPEVFQSEKRWEIFKNSYLGRGIKFFEIRDDLLSPEQIEKVFQSLIDEKIVFSLRRIRDFSSFLKGAEFAKILNMSARIDWAWELGTPIEILQYVAGEKLILSLHDKKYFSIWNAFSSAGAHMKYAPVIENFSELLQAHEWQQQSPSQHSFLPRSASGQARWEWYRLLQKDHQAINFWREDGGSAEDQPTLWAWLMAPSKPLGFAAVLGDPVYHSYTPVEHSDFFFKRNIPVLAVHVGRDEWVEAWPVLESLGLRYAAVTSPHKNTVAVMLGDPELPAVNTLFRNKRGVWKGTSTDLQGFEELIEGSGLISPLQNEIFVWGGGGTLSMIQKALPRASYFSARTGLPRRTTQRTLHEAPQEAMAETTVGNEKSPKILIWAASQSPQTKMPPEQWRPLLIFDLNYKEDSLGREYAQICGANYLSGLKMFLSQAQGQRFFWSQCEAKDLSQEQKL